MIDWDRIKELQSEIGADDLAEVVELFLDEANEVVEKLASQPPRAMIEAHLHFLKGSALNLGFADLAGLCQEGERRAAAGDAAEIDLQRVIAVYHASRQAFLEGLVRVLAA